MTVSTTYVAFKGALQNIALSGRKMERFRTAVKSLQYDPSTNTFSYGDCALSVAAPELWNSVHFEIRTAVNLNKFKSKLKTHLLESYFQPSVDLEIALLLIIMF